MIVDGCAARSAFVALGGAVLNREGVASGSATKKYIFDFFCRLLNTTFTLDNYYFCLSNDSDGSIV